MRKYTIHFDGERLDRVKKLQKEDEIKEMINVIKCKTASPNKNEALGLTDNWKKFYNQRLTFKATNQNILIRCWINESGRTTPLVVVNENDYRKLVKESKL